MTSIKRDDTRRALVRAHLPAGYSAQPAWGFELGPGRTLCEFNRVYGPSSIVQATVPVRPLDELRSYWAVTLPQLGEQRWLTFEEARRVIDAKMTFSQFSSLAYMAPRLPDLLGE